MKLFGRLERSVGRFAVPAITIYIVFLQSLAYVLTMATEARRAEEGGVFIQRLELIGTNVFHGEVWRVLTFVIIPPVTNPIFFFFAMYFL